MNVATPTPTSQNDIQHDEPTESVIAAQIVAPETEETGRNRFERVMVSPIGTVLPVIAVILLWEISSRLRIIDPIFFPAPSQIAGALIDLMQRGVITENLGITLNRVALGFVIGTIPAVILGIAIARVRWVYLILDPLISLTYPIPHIATLPLLLVIFGLGSPPIIALATIVCFYPAVVSTTVGVRQVDERLVAMAQNLGATRRQIMWKIVLPGALPAIFGGLRLSLGLALLGTVAGEFVAASAGIGAQTWIYWQIYQITNMYATLVVIVATGFLLTNMMLFIERRFFGWAKATYKE